MNWNNPWLGHVRASMLQWYQHINEQASEATILDLTRSRSYFHREWHREWQRKTLDKHTLAAWRDKFLHHFRNYTRLNWMKHSSLSEPWLFGLKNRMDMTRFRGFTILQLEWTTTGGSTYCVGHAHEISVMFLAGCSLDFLLIATTPLDTC